MTAYKRPDLLFADLEKLKAIAGKYSFQIVLAGKAHPQDWEGKQLIKLLNSHIHDLADVIPIAFLNGVPSLSILDGWWVEGCIEGVTGWSFGDDSGVVGKNDLKNLYDKLEEVVLPLYYENRTGWIKIMKGAISINASFFNSHRMMRRYATEAYLR